MSDGPTMGAIEAGGTKWVCAVGRANGKLLEEVVVETRHPEETVPVVAKAFEDLQGRHGSISAIGIGTFGPVKVDEKASDYGVIQKTPKEGWTGFDYRKAMVDVFGRKLPLLIDTDVNAAVLAESLEPANRSCRDLIYITVGTGIGGGMISNGVLWHGRTHPEMGHLVVPESALEPVPGFTSCPFHTFCIEGKASGTAMKERWGTPAQDLTEDHPAWALESDYLASMVMTLTATFTPDRIIFGGGVFLFQPLLEMVRTRFSQISGGYWDLSPMSEYIVGSSLSNRAGLKGALLLAGRAWSEEDSH